jgi:putative transcriptional regulator
MTKTKAKTKRNQSAADIMQSVGEMELLLRDGVDPRDRFPSHTIGFPDPPCYGPAEVRNLRERIGVSQGAFAALVGVSRMLVQGWERGVRQPSPMARRLLETIDRNPSEWIAGLRS